MPCYVDLDSAREVLFNVGIELSLRQMKRAADIDGLGKRKLPFFIDPIDKKLKIEKGLLLAIYKQCQTQAAQDSYIEPMD